MLLTLFEHITLNGFSSLLIKLIIKACLLQVCYNFASRNIATFCLNDSENIALFHHILYGNHLPWSRLWKSCTWDPTSDLEEIHKALPTVFFTNCKIRPVHPSKAYWNYFSKRCWYQKFYLNKTMLYMIKLM